MKMLFAILLATQLWAVDLSTIPDNTWTKLDNVSYVFPAGYNGEFSLRFWCNFTWDPDSGRILFYGGYNGDHNQIGSSIYTNAVYSLTPADGKVKFLNLSTYWNNPTWDTYVAGSGPETPHPRHTYGAFKYVPKYHNIYMAFGACAHTASCDATNIWKYNVPTNTWTKLTAPLPDGEIGGYDAQFTWLPGSDTLWTMTQNSGTWVNLYAFNLATETWSPAINYGVRTYASQHAAEDTLRKRILYLSATGYHFLNPATRTMVKFADTAAGQPANAVMAYIPTYDRYFIYNSGKKQVWTLDPSDTAWTRETNLSDPGKRIDRYIVYDAVNDVIATTTVDGEYYVFRYKPTGGSGTETRSLSHADFRINATPNPFNKALTIRLEGVGAAAVAELSVFDVRGKKVADLTQAAGHKGGSVWNPAGLPCGIYLVAAKTAAGNILQKRITLIR